MKKLFLLMVLAFLINSSLLSQSCLPQGITFTTQSQVDSFQTNYPNCTEIEGDVEISGANIVNLNGLNIISSIRGHLLIENNDLLTNLSGLENLITTGGYLSIENNNSLLTLNALTNLTSIGVFLQVTDNPAITGLSGLDNIDVNSFVHFTIAGNISLSTCEVKVICDYLDSPNGVATILSNASGCNSVQEVQDACDAIGISDYYTEPEILIFPNPSESMIFLSLKDKININEVNIYNQVGQKTLNLKQVSNTLDVSSLQQGMYIIELVSDDFIVRDKLIIK